MKRWLAPLLLLGAACNRAETPVCEDDGIFCNGIERLVDGACIKVPADPCDDGAECTVDECDEASRTCSHTPEGECAMCKSEDCSKDCGGRVCGADGCGGLCGACDALEGCTPGGACSAATGLGTCAMPRPLEVLLGADQAQVLQGDTSMSVHQLVPTCNSTSTAVEDVYSFTIVAPTGFEAISLGYDTVLHLRREECLNDAAAATVACSDDSAPPGDYGSRIATLLQPGTYYLAVDGFDATQFGPYELKVKFIADCVPNCDGQFCDGQDGCGGSCGTCPDGQACGVDLRCRPDPCAPNCTNMDGSPRSCGDDGCLGSCGSCGEGELCVPATGTCEAFATCDHDEPSCEPGCGPGEFCGADCRCHGAEEPLPDLVLNADRLRDEILFDEVNIGESSCAVVEKCVGGTGDRRLLRFSVEAINQGQATMVVPAPDTRPDLFIFSACHGHYHFNGFATYALLGPNDEVVVEGRKQAYCMEDTRQVHPGPNVGCSKQYDCANQGIQPGWSDLYGNTLDCQWLDITGVPAGDYKIQVTLNPNREFEEVTLDNNTATVPVTIPAQ